MLCGWKFRNLTSITSMGGVVDLHKGAPGLSALTLIGQVDEDALYVFSNLRRNLVKFLRVDKRGIWVGGRRMHHKRYFWP